MLHHEYINPIVAATPQEAFYAENKTVPIAESRGMICSEFVMSVSARNSDPGTRRADYKAIYSTIFSTQRKRAAS